MTLVDEAVLRQWVINNGRREALVSVAHLLCKLHLRMNLVGLVDDAKFSLPLTQEELAYSTGLTTVHMNRVLQKLRADGLVEIEQKILTVPNVPALRDTAGFDPCYLHLGISSLNGRKFHSGEADELASRVSGLIGMP